MASLPADVIQSLSTSTGSSGDPRQHALTVVMLPIESFHPDPRNPRLHSKRQIRQIANSIEAFGFNVPVLIDKDNMLVAGHGRVQACQLLGWTEVPVIRLEHLTPTQAKAFLIADNRLTDNSTWDDKLLAENLKELSVLDLDFKLDAIGFEMAEIDLRIEQLDASGEDEESDDDLVPASEAVPVTRTGDLWQLGDHRILCGSALEAIDYQVLMGSKHADMVFSDPPYNVKIDGHCIGNGKIQHREFAMGSGEMSSPEFTGFLSGAFTHLKLFSRAGSLHFLCMDWRHLPEILSAGNAVYHELKNVCVWVKDNAGMGALYRSQHELVLVFKQGTAPHINNIKLGKYGRHRSNVWQYAGINSFGRSTEEGNLLALHPTVKPVAMVADALFDCSNRGDLVLDPFLGSGTTVIAAERTGRCGYGMELDPLYVDVAIRRWQRLTGLEARLASTGESFAQREALAEACASNQAQPTPMVVGGMVLNEESGRV